MVNASATTAVRMAMVGVLEAGRIVTHGVSTPRTTYLMSVTCQKTSVVCWLNEHCSREAVPACIRRDFRD
jgi:hypothetical protein